MIVDASALISVVTGAPGYERIADLLADSARSSIGAPTLLETGMVLDGRAGARGRTALGRVTAEARLRVLPFTEEHERIALDAFSRFGKGRHEAALNFGDCCCYATAVVAGEPLLCVGENFARTDLELIPLDR